MSISYEVTTTARLEEDVVRVVARDVIEFLVGNGVLPLEDLNAANPNRVIDGLANNYVTARKEDS